MRAAPSRRSPGGGASPAAISRSLQREASRARATTPAASRAPPTGIAARQKLARTLTRMVGSLSSVGIEPGMRPRPSSVRSARAARRGPCAKPAQPPVRSSALISGRRPAGPCSCARSSTACFWTAFQSGSSAGTMVLPICCSGLPWASALERRERRVVFEIGAAGSSGADRREQGFEIDGMGVAQLQNRCLLAFTSRAVVNAVALADPTVAMGMARRVGRRRAAMILEAARSLTR